MAASSAQQQPTQNGHIVVEGNPLIAVRAGRPWTDDRQITWQPVDTHVQKAAKRQPEHKYRRCHNGVHRALSLAKRRFALVLRRLYGDGMACPEVTKGTVLLGRWEPKHRNRKVRKGNARGRLEKEKGARMTLRPFG